MSDRERPPPGLGAIFLILFLDILGFSLVLPFLAEEARATFDAPPFVGTLLASIYSLMQFLFVPVWGRLSDRVGRRPVLMWSVAATALGMTLLGVAIIRAESVVWLFLARAFSGIATANLGTASAYIADVTKPEERAKGMGVIGVAFGMGFILGPALGGALSGIPIGARHGAVPCFLAAGLSVANFAWASLGLRESLPPERRAKRRRSLAPLDVGAAREALSRPGIAVGVLVNFVMILSFTILDQTLRFFNSDLFSMDALDTGILLAFVGVVAATVQGALIRPLARRMDEAILIRAGAFLQAVAFAGFVVAPSVGRVGLYVAGALLAVGNGLTQPSVSSYVSRRADPQAQGGTLGTNQSFAALARMFGPGLGGFLYGALGPRSPYVVSAIGMALAGIVALGLHRNDQEGLAARVNGS
jgi:MFS family permease